MHVEPMMNSQVDERPLFMCNVLPRELMVVMREEEGWEDGGF